MYQLEFYEKTNGECDVWEFLENLRTKSATNKDARIQYKQVTFYIELLQQNGSTLSENIMKHIEDDRRKRKRRPGVKLKEPKQKEMIIKQGRWLNRNENMGRL